MVVLVSEYQNLSMYQAMTLSKDVLAKQNAGQSGPAGPPRVLIILTGNYGLSKDLSLPLSLSLSLCLSLLSLLN